jgi:hypothetical protein
LAPQVAELDDVEVIVAHDGPIPTGYHELSERYGFARLVEGDEHGGEAAARNLGIRHAVGEIILNMDADSYAGPGLLRSHLEHHRAKVSSGPAVGIGRRIDLDWADLAGFPANLEEIGSRAPDLRFPIGFDAGRDPEVVRACPWIFCQTHNISVPREAITEAGGFNESFTGWGLTDVEAFYRVFQSADRDGSSFAYLPDATVYHLPCLRVMSRRMKERAVNYRLGLEQHPQIDWEMGLDQLPLQAGPRIQEYRRRAALLATSPLGNLAPSLAKLARESAGGRGLVIVAGSPDTERAGGWTTTEFSDPSPVTADEEGRKPPAMALFGTRLPFGDGEFDHVMSIDVWRVLTGMDLERFLWEGLRVAGTLLLVETRSAPDLDLALAALEDRLIAEISRRSTSVKRIDLPEHRAVVINR